MEPSANPTLVEKSLKGIDFPANKQDLINHARKIQAPDDVMAVLSRMPDQNYANAADVAQGVGRVE